MGAKVCALLRRDRIAQSRTCARTSGSVWSVPPSWTPFRRCDLPKRSSASDKAGRTLPSAPVLPRDSPNHGKLPTYSGQHHIWTSPQERCCQLLTRRKALDNRVERLERSWCERVHSHQEQPAGSSWNSSDPASVVMRSIVGPHRVYPVHPRGARTNATRYLEYPRRFVTEMQLRDPLVLQLAS